jgi:HEPN domain-containing protein
MTRGDFQALAVIRLREARGLLAAGHREGAYYLAGYVVEFALKACIAKRTRRHEFPDRDRVKDSYTHDFKSLIRLSGLSEELAKEIRSNKEFQANWTLVLEWGVDSRYNTDVGEEVAGFIRAVSDRKPGYCDGSSDIGRDGRRGRETAPASP